MQPATIKHSAAVGFAALLTLAVATAFAPAAHAAKICPLYLVKSCVFNNKTHQIFTTFTNQCLASNAGLTVIYVGACKCGK